MKTVLYFMTVQHNDRYVVYFSATRDRSDTAAIEVDLQVATANPKLVAELAVMRHVLLESDLIENPCSETVTLQCSQGAIKKLLRKASAKKDANAFSRFLTTRFPGIAITIKHDNYLIKENSVIKKLTVNTPPMETEKTCLGNVKLTEHALARFQERFHCDKSIGMAAHILVNTLRNGKFKKLSIDSKKRHRSLIKHHHDAQYWGNGDSCFVTVPEHNHQVLVTVLHQAA